MHIKETIASKKLYLNLGLRHYAPDDVLGSIISEVRPEKIASLKT